MADSVDCGRERERATDREGAGKIDTMEEKEIRVGETVLEREQD